MGDDQIDDSDPIPVNYDHEISNLCKFICNDNSDNANENGAKKLFCLYSEAFKIRSHRQDFLNALDYRLNVILESKINQKKLSKLLRAIVIFIVKSVIESKNYDVFVTLTASSKSKRYHSSSYVRNTVAFFVALVVEYSVHMYKKTDDADDFPCVLEEAKFLDIYKELSQMAIVDDEITRTVIIDSLVTFQSIPRLMVNVPAERRAKNLILTGLFDPSEMVRKACVKNVEIEGSGEGHLYLEVLLKDSSLEIKRLAALELSKRIPLGVLPLEDARIVFNDKGLFLGDKIVREYFDMLVSWTHDLYCTIKRLNADDPATIEQFFEGLYYLINLMSFTKDMQPILIRIFERGRISHRYNLLKFVRTYAQMPHIFLMASNFKTVVNTFGKGDLTLDSVNKKLRRIVMWQSMVEYTCSHAVSEPTRSECRSLLLPTMTEFSHVFIDVWTKLGQRFNNYASQPRIIQVLNKMTIFYVKSLVFLDSDEHGLAEWSKTVLTVLADISFDACVDVIAVIIKVWLICSLNALKDPDHAINVLGDLINDLNKPEQQLNNTQEIFYPPDNVFEETQMPQTPPQQQPRTVENPVMFARIVRIFTGTLSSGIFKRTNPVLEGLVRNFFHNVSSSIDCLQEDVCIALASGAPLFDPTNCLYITRLTFEDPSSVRLYRLCLIMLNDTIAVHGLKKVNDTYFDPNFISEKTNQNVFDPKGNVENLFIYFSNEVHKQVYNISYRCMLRFVMFDYRHDFIKTATVLLMRTFMPNVNEKMKTMLNQFWIVFVSISREHQCRLSCFFANALKELATCELDDEITKVDKDAMVEFILDLTSYGALRTDAIDREFGTAHTFLARELIKIVLKGGDDMPISEIVATCLSKCEVTEVTDHKLLNDLTLGIHKVMNAAESAFFKDAYNTLFKRFEIAANYIRRNRIPSVVFVVKTKAEIRKALKELLCRVSGHNERRYTQPWINDDDDDKDMCELNETQTLVKDGDFVRCSQDVPTAQPCVSNASTNDSVSSKIKIWAERNVTVEKLKTKYSRSSTYFSTSVPPGPPPSKRPRRANSRARSQSVNAEPASSMESLPNDQNSMNTPVFRSGLNTRGDRQLSVVHENADEE